MGLRGLKTGLFGSDRLINKMVSPIPNKYLEILESDNLNLDQVYINLEYLEEAEQNLLYPKEILMPHIRTDPITFMKVLGRLKESLFP